MPSKNTLPSQTRAELVQDIAVRLAKPFSGDDPFKDFGLSLARGQTRDRAVAEWYAMTLAAIQVGMEHSLPSKDKAEPILSSLQEVLSLKQTPGSRRGFLQIVGDRRVEYVREIYEAIYSDDGTKLMALSIKMAGRIVGRYGDVSESTCSPDVLEYSTTIVYKLGRFIPGIQGLFNTLQVTRPLAFSDD
jgi:hypothetical protein